METATPQCSVSVAFGLNVAGLHVRGGGDTLNTIIAQRTSARSATAVRMSRRFDATKVSMSTRRPSLPHVLATATKGMEWGPSEPPDPAVPQLAQSGAPIRRTRQPRA